VILANKILLKGVTPQETLLIPSHQALRPFQANAIHKMLSFIRTNESSGTYNACDQGLGKTCMSIVAHNNLNCRTLLVICPASVILNWVEELKSWSIYPHTYLAVLSSKDAPNIKLPINSAVIISYDMSKKDRVLKQLCLRNWDMLILDEGHKLIGRKTIRSKAILGAIWDKCRYRIALSGTPITGSVVDAYPLFHSFLPTTFPNFYAFANRYANIDRTPWGDKYYGIKNSEELKAIIRSSFFLRYTKEEVLPELPPKVFTKIVLPEEYALSLPKNDKDVLAAEVERIRLKIEKGNPAPPLPVSLAGKRREQALKKLPPVIEFIKNLLDQNIPTVVFTYHTQVLINLEVEFTSYNPSIIQGSTPSEARQDAVRNFQEGATNLFIGQIVAAGTGITLTRSSNVVFAELDWSVANVAQACDRLDRIGQLNTVNVYYFSVLHSIEERIISTIMQKAEVFSKMMSN